jgi:integrase
LVRQSEQKRARKKRNSFKPNEVKRLFQHPVWKGCKSSSRRHEGGELVQKDGLFFVPLIVAYTGSRMEEIAGLATDDIVRSDEHYGFSIQPHQERRIKNFQSERLLPLHEHLIELGLIEHQQRMQEKGEIYLFPELYNPHEKHKFYHNLSYNWQKLRGIQFDGNPRMLDGHSLRHAFNQKLKQEKSVLRQVRLDILGHGGADLNEEVYGDEEGMPFHLKKAAIDLLPRVF